MNASACPANEDANPVDVLSAILVRLQERQSVAQELFYRKNTPVNELRAMILLDFTIILRDSLNDIKAAQHQEKEQ